MWIPYTDAVVVVQCNPEGKATVPMAANNNTDDSRLQPLRGECGALKGRLDVMGGVCFCSGADAHMYVLMY